MHNGLQILIYGRGQFLLITNTGEQHDVVQNAVVPELHCFRNSRDRECVDIREASRNRKHSVAIGISLNDGHDFGVRIGAANDVEIMFECVEPD